MGQDNSPKVRQLARQERKAARRASYPRILIVSEGSKTEPLYFGDIRATYRLHSANVHVQPSQLGTAPVQVVEYARQLFKEGDLHKSIRPLSFDQVFAVFDRDDHVSYVEALNLADSLDGKLKNDAKEYVSFTAVAMMKPHCRSSGMSWPSASRRTIGMRLRGKASSLPARSSSTSTFSMTSRR